MNTNPTAFIEKLSHDGRGIAHIDGKTTFIQGAITNETVEFQILKRKSGFDEGLVVAVTHASPYRVTPKCHYFEKCGGCSLQHIDGAAQINEKQALFLDVLARIGHCQPDDLLPPLTASHWHYRNKARLSVSYNEKRRSVSVGFREKYNPSQILAIQQCPVLNQRVEEQLVNLEQLIASLDKPSSIAQIEIAAGDEDIALIFRHLSPLSKSDEVKLIAFGETSQFHLYLQPKGLDSVYLFYPKNVSNYLSYSLPEEGITFSFLPTDFTQINPALNRLMIGSAIDLLNLQPDDVVLDLFCGLGNFSLPISKYCTKVIGIEGSKSMVERASMNAELNGIKNATFFTLNLDDDAVFQKLPQQRFTKLLLDPPRTGAHEIVKFIEKLNPERIVYVSCNPATLARDADVLIHQKGYRMIKAGVMNMFPHTEHVESIAVFEKG